MIWSLPKLHYLTKKGSSGVTMARPRATAIDLCRHNRAFCVIETMPGVSHVAMIPSSWCPSTRACLQARTLAGLSCQWRSQALSFRKAKIAVARGSSAVQRTCSRQTILRKRGKMAFMFCSMNSVQTMRGTDELSETRPQSKRRIPPVCTYKCMAYLVTRRLLFASRIRGSVVHLSESAIKLVGRTLIRTMFTPAPVSKTVRQLRITRMHGPSVAAISCCSKARRNNLFTVRCASHRATPSRAPGRGFFRVIDVFRRMLVRVIYGVAVGNDMNAGRRLVTFASAIRLGTWCSEVLRLVTVVSDVSPVGVRDGGPRERRRAYR